MITAPMSSPDPAPSDTAVVTTPGPARVEVPTTAHLHPDVKDLIDQALQASPGGWAPWLRVLAVFLFGSIPMLLTAWIDAHKPQPPVVVTKPAGPKVEANTSGDEPAADPFGLAAEASPAAAAAKMWRSELGKALGSLIPEELASSSVGRILAERSKGAFAKLRATLKTQEDARAAAEAFK